MESKNIRIIAGVFLALVIVGFSIFVFANRGNLFYSTVRVSYPDRCVEQYKGDVLVSPECTVGRQMLEDKLNKSKMGYGYLPVDNLNFNGTTNVTTVLDTTTQITPNITEIQALVNQTYNDTPLIEPINSTDLVNFTVNLTANNTILITATINMSVNETVNSTYLNTTNTTI